MKKPLLNAAIFVLSLLVMTSTVSAYPQKPQVAASTTPNEVITEVKVPMPEAPIEKITEEIKPVPPAPAAPVAAKPKTVAAKKITAKTPAVKPAAVPVAKPAPKLPLVPQNISCDGGSNTQFLCLLNQYRKSKGLNSLSYEAALNATALDHSIWMNANNSMSHLGENGSRFFDRCKAHNTTCDGENVARGYTSAQKLFDAWKASPSHNANMLGSHTRLGLGFSGTFATLVMR